MVELMHCSPPQGPPTHWILPCIKTAVGLYSVSHNEELSWNENQELVLHMPLTEMLLSDQEGEDALKCSGDGSKNELILPEYVTLIVQTR